MCWNVYLWFVECWGNVLINVSSDDIAVIWVHQQFLGQCCVGVAIAECHFEPFICAACLRSLAPCCAAPQVTCSAFWCWWCAHSKCLSLSSLQLLHVLLLSLDELSQRNCTDDSLIIVNVIDPPTKLYAHAITFDEENVKYHRLFQAVNSLAPGRA